ncbi:MAG TPA: hypothetical protein VLB51_11425 [Methylomirabilota bacterium]|nr:hypothetical protein [Methylomirabilota bacterium]
MRKSRPWFAIGLVSGLLAWSCDSGPESGLVIPDSPDGAVQVVLSGLAAHRPEVMWRALPPSYQDDISGLVRSFADHVEPALHQRAVVVARKAVVVLQAKKELILTSDTIRAATAADPAAVDAAWEAAVHAADIVLSSELADLEALRELDVESFLATTGRALMDRAAEIPAIGGEGEGFADRLESLGEAEVELVAADGDRATVRIRLPDLAPFEIDMVRVEGRWLPVELASRWPEAVESAAARIEAMAGDQAARVELVAFVALGVAESFLDQLAGVTTAEELDRLVGAFLGNLLGQPLGVL